MFAAVWRMILTNSEVVGGDPLIFRRLDRFADFFDACAPRRRSRAFENGVRTSVASGKEISGASEFVYVR